MEQSRDSQSTQTTPHDALVESVDRARSAWQRTGMRVRSITPSELAQTLLVLAAAILIGWLLWQARVALLPFMVGAILAYTMLPVVNRLDRFLPRWLSAVLVMVASVAVLAGLLALVVPSFSDQMVSLATQIPTGDEIRAWIDDLVAYVRTMPEPAQDIIQTVLTQVGVKVRANLSEYVGQLSGVVVNGIVGLFRVFGFLLGLLVIPSWLLAVLNDQKKGIRAVNRLLPRRAQADFWAVVRILDRTLSTFLRGRLFLGVVTAILVYAGLNVVGALLHPVGNYDIILGVFAGFMALIPSIGGILAALPAVVLALTVSWQLALVILALYVAIFWLIGILVAPHVERRVVDIHPVILVVAIVALSELGILWVLLAAPAITIFRDIFNYIYGRLGDPPKPAGVLPGDVSAASRRTAAAPSPHVPLSYQRTEALRRKRGA